MDDSFKSYFNISGDLTESIAKLLDKASNYYEINDLGGAWRCLKAVQGRVVQLINNEQEAELEKAADLASNYIVASKSLNNQGRVNRKIESFALKYYENYNKILMKLLQEKDLLLLAKKDSSKMKF